MMSEITYTFSDVLIKYKDLFEGIRNNKKI